MQLKEIMTRTVETVGSDASLAEAARKMQDKEIGFLPVVNGGQVVGVITDRDITVRAVARGLDPEQTTVEETMTHRIVALPENSEVEDASELMEQRRVRRLVITSETDALAGVVSLDSLAVHISRYGVPGDGLEGEANADTREFPVGFDPAAQADESEAQTAIGTDPSVTTEAQIVERNARDQTDPRTGPRTLIEQTGKARR